MAKVLTFTMSQANGEFIDKIKTIKGLRALAGISLKEAKAFSEEIQEKNSVTTSINYAAVDIEEATALIVQGGINVLDNDGRDRADLLSTIKGIALSAIETSHYDLARSLIAILESNR